jgi:hypothetical protein
MQRRLIRALATSFLPLVGLAAAFAMSGCAAVPAINLANSLIHPPQQAQPAQPAAPAQPGQPAASAAPAASPDIFGALAQHFGITLPTASAPTIQTATTPSFTTTPALTTTAAK